MSILDISSHVNKIPEPPQAMGKRLSGLDKLRAYQGGMSVGEIEDLDRRARKHKERDYGDLDSLI